MMVSVVLLAIGAGNVLRQKPKVELEPTDLPRMVFLGSGKCQPCREMEPVREALRTQYADTVIIEYHDVVKNPEQGHLFGIRSIPTTIFVAPAGFELRRRGGYMSETDIVNQWRELGFALYKEKSHEQERE